MALWPTRDGGRVLPSSRRRPEPDPFVGLHLQMSLTRLEREIAAIRADGVSFGRAHKLFAACAAYDGVLADACRLVGVPLDDAVEDRGDRFDAVSRVQAEAGLAALGWTW